MNKLQEANILDTENTSAESIHERNQLWIQQANHWMNKFASIVNFNAGFTLTWLKNILTKSYNLANMEAKIVYKYEYLRELTNAYIVYNTRIKTTNLALNDDHIFAGKKFINCDICRSADSDQYTTLTCGHHYHTECFATGIKAYLNQEKISKIGYCLSEYCKNKISPVQFSKLIPDVETLIAIQKMHIRSISGVLFCPACPEGLAKKNKFLGFAYNCTGCKQELCFACGNKPHIGRSCERAKNIANIGLLNSVLGTAEEHLYGKCPHCHIMIGKNGGCNNMVCGRDKDKTDVSYIGRGCGKEFNWDNRITLQQWANQLGVDKPSQATSIPIPKV